jgi:Fic family protein
VVHGRPLYRDQAEKDRLEARNARLQYRRVLDLIAICRGGPKGPGNELRVTPEAIKDLHCVAIEGIYSCAGHFRSWRVRIISSRHKPPESDGLDGLVQDMCDQANAGEWDPIQTAAFLLRKLNWIHPFAGGNGRTSRAVAMLALSVRLGFLPPGRPTMAEYLDANRARYLEALRDADEAWTNGVIDVGLMTALLHEMLEHQLSTIADPDDPLPGHR